MSNSNGDTGYKRFFWLCIAAVIGSLGLGIAGLCVQVDANATTTNELKHQSKAIDNVDASVKDTKTYLEARILAIENRLRALEIATGKGADE